jgi:hypothetical protein
MSNTGAAAVERSARSSAELEKALADISFPALARALGEQLGDLGAPGSEPASVASQFRQARETLMGDYSAEQERAKADILQQARSSGYNYSPQAISEATSSASRTLASGEARSLRALNFQEANAGLDQTNQMLNAINAGAGNVLSGSFRFGQNALQADQLLAQAIEMRRRQNSTYGGIAGTVVGGILGSYFPGVGTALGAGVGGALGGAAGGFFG